MLRALQALTKLDSCVVTHIYILIFPVFHYNSNSHIHERFIEKKVLGAIGTTYKETEEDCIMRKSLTIRISHNYLGTMRWAGHVASI